MGFADGIHIKSVGMQLWAATFARLMTSAEAVDPSCLPCSPPLLAIQMWRKREGERTRGKRKELLITCFVWSESPCKYMNSKCRKSNLVAHWYILLFAYLPAPVVSSCISGLGTSNTQRYAYIFFLFYTTVSLSFSISPSFVSFSFLSIVFPLLFSFLPLQPLLYFTHPFPSVSLRHQGVFPPRQEAWQGSRWNGEQMTNLSLRPSLHLPLSLSRSHPLSCQRPSSAFLPPSLQHLPILSDHIDIQIWPGCLPPSLCVKVLPNRQGRKKVG